MTTSQPYTITVDDDPIVPRMIEAAVGIRTLEFASAKQMLAQTASLLPKAVFVDIHLDGENGLTTLPEIRSRWPYVPILVVTADSTEERISEALAMGADDFILKPLRPIEVVARLQARLADQALKQASQNLAWGDLKLDQAQRVLHGPKGERFLSPTELGLLAALIKGAGNTLERNLLKALCWEGLAVSDNALDRKVFEVRKAITEVGSDCVVRTTYGIGFALSGTQN